MNTQFSGSGTPAIAGGEQSSGTLDTLDARLPLRPQIGDLSEYARKASADVAAARRSTIGFKLSTPEQDVLDSFLDKISHLDRSSADFNLAATKFCSLCGLVYLLKIDETNTDYSIMPNQKKFSASMIKLLDEKPDYALAVAIYGVDLKNTRFYTLAAEQLQRIMAAPPALIDEAAIARMTGHLE